MKPYYEHAGITIYHGDSREIMPRLTADVVITDPVWPNAHPDLVGAEDPVGLWGGGVRAAWERLPEEIRRETRRAG